MHLILFYKHSFEIWFFLLWKDGWNKTLLQSVEIFSSQHMRQCNLKGTSLKANVKEFSILAHRMKLLCVFIHCGHHAGRLQNAAFGFISSCDSF